MRRGATPSPRSWTSWTLPSPTRWRGSASVPAVFGDRFLLAYFTHRYGIEAFAAFPGCSHETEPAAGTMSALIDRVREGEHQHRVLYGAFNHAVADAIADDTGAKPLCCIAAATSQGRSSTAARPISLMRQNLRTLEEAYAHAAD